jgi:hypothetical protein
MAQAAEDLTSTEGLLEEYEISLAMEGRLKRTLQAYRYRVEHACHLDGKYRNRQPGEPPRA